MIRPTVGSFAERIYDALKPLAPDDAAYGWPLLAFFGAIGGAFFQNVEDLARETDAGPGWSALVDVDRCPDNALPFLGQLVGVPVDTGADPAFQRAQIVAHAGFRRGSPGSFKQAAEPTLTGNRTVLLFERDTSAYHLTIRTYATETPDAAVTEAALRTQKPAGIVLDYDGTLGGQTWQQLLDNHPTWQDVKDDYATWQDVRDDTP